MLETTTSTREKESDVLITGRELATKLGYSISYINTLARKKWFPDGVVYESPGGHRRYWKNKAIKLFDVNYRKRRAR